MKAFHVVSTAVSAVCTPVEQQEETQRVIDGALSRFIYMHGGETGSAAVRAFAMSHIEDGKMMPSKASKVGSILEIL